MSKKILGCTNHLFEQVDFIRFLLYLLSKLLAIEIIKLLKISIQNQINKIFNRFT
jgi:hypothetical protein